MLFNRDRARQAMHAAPAGNQADPGSGSAKIAFSAAIMMSQAKAVSKPPPIATPLTAAINGFSRSKRLRSPANPRGPSAGASPPEPSGHCRRRTPAPRPR